MAADHWTIEYHLTSDGWVTGTSTTFSKIDGQAVPRPDGAVETWEEDCYQSSIWSGEQYSHKLLWHNPSISEADRMALRKKFPSPFTEDKR